MGKTLKDIEQLRDDKRGRQSVDATECAKCGALTKEWALRRVGYFRSRKEGDKYVQKQFGGYSDGRWCADCIIKDLEAHP